MPKHIVYSDSIRIAVLLWHPSATEVTDCRMSHRALVHHQPLLSLDLAHSASQISLVRDNMLLHSHRKKKQVTDRLLNLMAMWRRIFDGHGLNSLRAWHGCGQHNRKVRRWLLDTFQTVSFCYPSLSNFVRPLSLAVSFMLSWRQLTPVGSVSCCFTSALYHPLPATLTLSCCHITFP